MALNDSDEVMERIGRIERGERKGLFKADFSDGELCLIIDTCGESFLERHFA